MRQRNLLNSSYATPQKVEQAVADLRSASRPTW
jgi:hypothetical protein